MIFLNQTGSGFFFAEDRSPRPEGVEGKNGYHDEVETETYSKMAFKSEKNEKSLGDIHQLKTGDFQK